MRKKTLDITLDFPFKKGDIIVFGCSSGSDSMALFHLLLELRKTLDISLACAHVNHHVRKESDEEQEFLKDYCAKEQVVFETMTIEKYGDDNFHNEARAIRYRFFEDVVHKYQASYLLTAHHADDLMETILMRLVRGSTLRGYSGFSKVVLKQDYKIVRPLLRYTKDQLVKYVQEHHIPYREDASNHKMKYTRNRFRKHVLPFLKTEDPCVHEKFLKFSLLLQEVADYLEEVSKKEFSKVFKEDTLHIEPFLKLDPLLQKMVLYLVLESIYQDDLMLVDDRHVDSLLSLIRSKRANSRIYLPNEVVVKKSYQELYFENKADVLASYEIELEDFAYLPNGKHLAIVDEEDGTGNDVSRLDSKECVLPLTVRTRKLGDKMSLKGTNGQKKLKDIFIDKKVPLSDRDLWPVVVDAKGTIVFLPGLQKSKFDKSKSENYDIIVKYY